MAKGKSGTMLDDGEIEQTTATQLAPAPVTDTGRPYCERHNCLMIANGTKDQVTYYRCQVPGCDCRSKQARVTTPIPGKPMTCAMASCCHGDERQYLEVDAARSSIAQFAMTCPKCGNTVYVTRPTYGESVKRDARRAVVTGFDER